MPSSSGSTTSASIVPTTKSKSKAVAPPVHQASNEPTLPNREKGLELLVEYCDTFYSDTDAWAMLADVYAGLGL